jgi:hypothetical protein
MMRRKKRRKNMGMRLAHPTLGLMSMLGLAPKLKGTKTKKEPKYSHLQIKHRILKVMDRITNRIIR